MIYKISQVFIADNFHNAVLVLNDGKCFLGNGVGITGKTSGEICFNTSMTGYQEVLTDPSYAQQIITFTFPHVGNVGCNPDDAESNTVFCNGLVIREPISEACNYRAAESLNEWLINNKIIGISNIDTRELTRYITKNGAQGAIIYHAVLGEEINLWELQEEASRISDLNKVELAKLVTTKKHYESNESLFDLKTNKYPMVRGSGEKFEELGQLNKVVQSKNVVVIDYGVKRNILCCLVESGCRVTVVSATASFAEIIALQPDGVFLSNGPGDPQATYNYAKEVLLQLINSNIPIFGICMGHQLLALALGLNTVKMAQGHRGANHPVKNLITNKVEITSQNHGFCVEIDNSTNNNCSSSDNICSNGSQEFSLKTGCGSINDIEITHISLFDRSIEGIEHKHKPIFSVQYHPESSPGPEDSRYLFDKFVSMMSK